MSHEIHNAVYWKAECDRLRGELALDGRACACRSEDAGETLTTMCAAHEALTVRAEKAEAALTNAEQVAQVRTDQRDAALAKLAAAEADAEEAITQLVHMASEAHRILLQCPDNYHDAHDHFAWRKCSAFCCVRAREAEAAHRARIGGKP